MNKKFIMDYERFAPNNYNPIACFLKMMKNHELSYIFWGRQLEFAKNPIKKSWQK